MTFWKRTFGVDLVETLLWGACSFLIGVLAVEFFHDRMVGFGVALVSLLGYGIRRHLILRSLPPATESSGGWRAADLEARVAELEALHARVAELEERVDFSERLLAKGPDRVEAPR